VTVITPGAGCSITSTATVSTTGATGCFTFRATFFAGAGLGLALATVRLVAFPRAALDTLRALPRAVAVFLFSALDCFLRLAMIRPVLVGGPQRIDAGSPTPSNPSNELSTDRNLSAATLALFFLGQTERSLFFERKDWDEGEGLHPVSTPNGCRVSTGAARHVWGTTAKPLAAYRRRLCCFEEAVSIQDHQEKHDDEQVDNAD
jgi:hypothetical protein